MRVAVQRFANYTSKWIVSRWRTQRPNRRRSVNECNGDFSPIVGLLTRLGNP
jgi:hypothetical protein